MLSTAVNLMARGGLQLLDGESGLILPTTAAGDDDAKCHRKERYLHPKMHTQM